MNFKNVTENLIITIVVALVSGTIGYWASVASNTITIELLRPTIEEAIRKETTTISNEFKTEIKKLKAKQDANVIIETTPEVTSRITPPKKRRKKWFKSSKRQDL